MNKNQTKRSRASTKKFYERACRNCGAVVTMSKAQHFCTPECKGKYKYTINKVTTESQYEKINGNWKKYSQRLLYFGGRRRDQLTWEIILNKIKEQNYKCALSGVDLTCYLEKGKKVNTNASIDRIIAGGPYTKDNIQVVCRALNYWRSDQTIEEFIGWCKKVTEFNNTK